MYGYRGLQSLRAEKMIIFEVMKDLVRHSQSNSTYRLGPSDCPSENMGHLAQLSVDKENFAGHQPTLLYDLLGLRVVHSNLRI